MLRLRYDDLTWRWQSLIVGYDTDRQFEFLENVFGEFSAQKFAAVLLGTGALVLVPVGFSLLGRRKVRERPPEDKHYLTFCARLAKLGVERQSGEAPGVFALRAAEELPAAAGDIERITALYDDLAYSDYGVGGRSHSDLLLLLKRAVSGFRPLGN
jgi:hypothetical protein